MYSTNAEYRAIFRAYFKMDIQALEREHVDLKESDPESFDELLYDDAAVKNGMHDLYEKTKDNPKFIELYRLAAGQFLTEDPEIGLCVLFTYDYFSDYIALIENPHDESLYNRLKAKL